MSFVSLEFIIFFPVVLLFNYFTKGILKSLLLLISSLYFYMTLMRQNSAFLFVLLITAYAGLLFYGVIKNQKGRKYLLFINLLVVLIFLSVSKYLPFFNEITEFLAGKTIVKTNVLPSLLGLSYVVFQLISYNLDVYNNKIKAEKNILHYLNYILFFPKIISGPIERAGYILPQLKENGKLKPEVFIKGLKYFIFGFALKVVIADRLGFAVDRVFQNLESFNSADTLLSVLFYTFQLYTDFYGYSLMAIGTSNMLGIVMINNFHMPFFSKSISEFWKRWHISLSFWLRDYLFLTLSYYLVRKAMIMKTSIKPEKISYVTATFIAMLVCGIWHGPKLTFVLWGIIHAFFMIFSFVTKSYRRKLLKKSGINQKSTFMDVSRTVFVFALLVFSFAVFRSENIEQFVNIMANIFSFNVKNHSKLMFYNSADYYISLVSVCLLVILEFVQYSKDRGEYKYQVTELITVPVLILLIAAIFLFGKFGEIDFIYFKF
jgi:alginate O-acetyltransferase complex protein AlgI